MDIFQVGYLLVYMLCLSPIQEPGDQFCYVVLDTEGESTEAVCRKAEKVWNRSNPEIPLKSECAQHRIHFLREIVGRPA